MSIFDYLPCEDFAIPMENLAEKVGNTIGCLFIPSGWKEEYEAKIGKLKLSLQYNTYNTGDERQGKKFLSVGYDFKTEGGGRPCDTLEEAIAYLQKAIEKYKPITKIKGKE